MASKRRNRRLSLPKNWRVQKNTRKNGEVFYCAQYRGYLGYWWDFRSYEDPTLDKVKERITKEITKHAYDYNEQCGEEVEKKEYINFK